MRVEGEDFVGSIELPRSGGLAVYGEAEFEEDGRTFTLSTPTAVYGSSPETDNVRPHAALPTS
jgi:hypothetical protein